MKLKDLVSQHGYTAVCPSCEAVSTNGAWEELEKFVTDHDHEVRVNLLHPDGVIHLTFQAGTLAKVSSETR